MLPLHHTRIKTLPVNAFRQRECKGKRNSGENKYSVLFHYKKAASEVSEAAFYLAVMLKLVENFGYLTGTYRTATLTDSETQAFLHCHLAD